MNFLQRKGWWLILWGLLQKALYGLRDAPLIWKWHLAATVRKLQFREGPAMPPVFRHQPRGVMMGVKVDDIMPCGPEEHFTWLYHELQRICDIKSLPIFGTFTRISFDHFKKRLVNWLNTPPSTCCPSCSPWSNPTIVQSGSAF